MSESCPGLPSALRPAVRLAMCRNCRHLDIEATRKAPARHDGQQWQCVEWAEPETPNGPQCPKME